MPPPPSLAGPIGTLDIPDSFDQEPQARDVDKQRKWLGRVRARRPRFKQQKQRARLGEQSEQCREGVEGVKEQGLCSGDRFDFGHSSISERGR